MRGKSLLEKLFRRHKNFKTLGCALQSMEVQEYVTFSKMYITYLGKVQNPGSLTVKSNNLYYVVRF